MYVTEVGSQSITCPELFFTHATTEGRPDHVLDWLEPRPPRPGPDAPLDLQEALGHLAHVRDTWDTWVQWSQVTCQMSQGRWSLVNLRVFLLKKTYRNRSIGLNIEKLYTLKNQWRGICQGLGPAPGQVKVWVNSNFSHLSMSYVTHFLVENIWQEER